MKTGIVVDKCFLQGTSTVRVQELATSHRLLVSDALFYELLTADGPARRKCFAKFPAEENPVDLISHVGVMMRFEIDNQTPAGKPSAHRENDVPFRFNDALLSEDYELPADARRNIEEHTAQLRSDVMTYLNRVEVVPTFFPNLLSGTTDERKVAVEEAERAIATPGALLPLYSNLEPPFGEKPLPPIERVCEHWAVYRYLQAQMLFALDVFVKYQGRTPDVSNQNIYERMEHDVLDAQVLILGCLEGAFATHERKLQRWWKVLCPYGQLYE
jgi:hypothetical protein